MAEQLKQHDESPLSYFDGDSLLRKKTTSDQMFDKVSWDVKEPRSKEFQQGYKAHLRYLCGEAVNPPIAPYEFGTAQCDAFYMGADESIRLFKAKADDQKFGIGLKRCPFCKKHESVGVWTSKDAHDLYPEHGFFGGIMYQVICNASTQSGLGGCGAGTGWKSSHAEAVESWNLGYDHAAHGHDFPIFAKLNLNEATKLEPMEDWPKIISAFRQFMEVVKTTNGGITANDFYDVWCAFEKSWRSSALENSR